MIKFFRKIRQKMLSENKVRQYLLYAIGEIILVVIGILIALQINNWNEGRKATNKLHNYTQKLINDIVSDTVNLNMLINKGKKRQLEIETYFEYFDSGNNTLDKLLDSAYQVDLTLFRYLPISYTFQDMQQSGNTDLLNENQRKAFVELNNAQEFLIIIIEKAIADIKEEQYKRNTYLDFDLSNSNFFEITSWSQNDDSKHQGLLHFHNVLTNYHNLIRWMENQGIVIREKSKKCLELLTIKE
jgi:hypothetical protein